MDWTAPHPQRLFLSMDFKNGEHRPAAPIRRTDQPVPRRGPNLSAATLSRTSCFARLRRDVSPAEFRRRFLR